MDLIHDTKIARRTQDLKYAKADRAARRFCGTQGRHAAYALRTLNKTERRAAKGFCRHFTGNLEIFPAHMGPYHARHNA